MDPNCRIKSLAWLPNKNGFRFIGILRGGKEIECQVVKDVNGAHRVSGAPYKDLIGWRDV